MILTFFGLVFVPLRTSNYYVWGLFSYVKLLVFLRFERLIFLRLWISDLTCGG